MSDSRSDPPKVPYSRWRQRFRVTPRTAIAAVGALAVLLFLVLPTVAAIISSLSSSPTAPLRGDKVSTPGSGPAPVDRRTLAAKIALEMTDQSGNKPDLVTCPADLTASVGTSVECQVTIAGKVSMVNATVTSLTGDKVNFNVVETIDKNEVATDIGDQLGQHLGHHPEAVACPNDLAATVGATVRCTMTDGGSAYGVTVTVQAAQDGKLQLAITPDSAPSSAK